MTNFLRHAFAMLLASNLAAQTQFQLTSTPAASFPLSLLAARDFDGDGDLDLFGTGGMTVSSPSKVLLRNDGRGRFVDVTGSHLPPAALVALAAVTAMVAFDMDGDGHDDLFLCEQATARLWRNSGNGVFTDVSGNLPGVSHPLGAVAAADFDGDGDVDLAVGGYFFYGSQNAMLVNDGTGVFTASNPFVGSSTFSIAAADIDDDADVDLLVGETSGPRLWRNDGGLVFTDVTGQQMPVLAGGNTQSLGFGDLDGDGDQDLVVANSQGPADHVLRNTAGTFTVIANPFTGPGATSSVVLADVDEDGDLDLVRARSLSSMALALNDGSGVFVDATARLPNVPSTFGSILAADLEGDGDLDVLVGDAFQPFSMLRNRHRHLEAGPVVLGQTWTITVWSTPGYATLDHVSRLAIAAQRLPQPLQIPGFGALWLDLDAGYFLSNAIVFAASGQHQYGFGVPYVPALLGVELHVQAVIEQARAAARFTGYDSLVVR